MLQVGVQETDCTRTDRLVQFPN